VAEGGEEVHALRHELRRLRIAWMLRCCCIPFLGKIRWLRRWSLGGEGKEEEAKEEEAKGERREKMENIVAPCEYACTCVHACMCLCACLDLSCARDCVTVYVYMYMFTSMCVYTYVCIHIRWACLGMSKNRHVCVCAYECVVVMSDWICFCMCTGNSLQSMTSTCIHT